MGNVAGVYSIMQHKMRVLQVSFILASRSDAPDRRRRTGMRAPAPQQLAAFASTRRSASRGLTPPRPRRRRSLRRGRAARRNPAPAAARRPRRRPRPARPLRNPTSSPAIFVDHVAMWNMRENGRAEKKDISHVPSCQTALHNPLVAFPDPRCTNRTQAIQRAAFLSRRNASDGHISLDASPSPEGPRIVYKQYRAVLKNEVRHSNCKD